MSWRTGREAARLQEIAYELEAAGVLLQREPHVFPRLRPPTPPGSPDAKKPEHEAEKDKKGKGEKKVKGDKGAKK